MGKKVKTGKSRKDKFYHLAKETGYRARSAFKLLQLNRKFEFLQKSRICIDLCAAPGGWLQVAAREMPISSVIIGVDLVPIKAIPGVTTFQEDITTDKCRQTLKKELQDWKADVVCNDGAPNVGMNWLHDAFMQAQLTLSALKLATEFLKKGGWFVTKVFRSKDYHALMWVFNQLFRKVHATKPQASRNESAEIFVVCQGYHAPDKLDPRFLDPKYVFKEVNMDPKTGLNLVHPEKISKKAEGYMDGDYLQHTKLMASKFVNASNHLELLAQCSEIVIDDKQILEHPKTTIEIKECCKDVKVLGKKEIRSMIAWQKALKKYFDTLEKENEKENQDAKEGEEDMDASDGEQESDEEVKDGDSDDDESSGEEMESWQGSDDEESSGENTDEEDIDEGSESDENKEEINDTKEDESDDEKEIMDQVQQRKEEEQKEMKKKKKKVAKEKRKLRDKMALNMVIPGDRIDQSDDIALFDLKKIKNKNQLTRVEEDNMEAVQAALLEENSDSEAEHGKKKVMTYERYKEEMPIGDDGGSSSEEEGEEEGEESEISDNEEPTENLEVEPSNANPLVVEMESRDARTQRRMEMWFNKDVFNGLEGEEDEDLEIEKVTQAYEKKGGVILGKEKSTEKPETIESKKKAKTESITKMENTEESDDEDSSDSDSDSDSESENELQSVMPNGKRKRSMAEKAAVKDGFEVVPVGHPVGKVRKLDSTGLAIGEEMVKSSKRRREIEEMSFHRFTFNDDHLPDWFELDERKHLKRPVPVTKQQVEFYKERQKAIDARPIKKVAEAKARKHKKMMRRLERARKKAEAVGDTVDTSEKEKMSKIKDIYKKAGLLKKKKESVTYVVAKRGTGKRVSRPAGVKGHFKVVDGRMKKDDRKRKATEKQSRKKGGKKTGKGKR